MRLGTGEMSSAEPPVASRSVACARRHEEVDMDVRPKKKAGGLWAGRLHHWDSEMHICAGGDDQRCQLLERRACERQRATGRDVLARLFVHMQHRHDWRVRASWLAGTGWRRPP